MIHYIINTMKVDQIQNYSLLYWIMQNSYGKEDLNSTVIFIINTAHPNCVGNTVVLEARDFRTGKVRSDLFLMISKSEFEECFIPDSLKTFRYEVERERENNE